MDDGVARPLEIPVPLLAAPSLESSVERSVRKLARERRRKLLRNDGAMIRNEAKG